jgi:hypothetical protein
MNDLASGLTPPGQQHSQPKSLAIYVASDNKLNQYTLTSPNQPLWF